MDGNSEKIFSISNILMNLPTKNLGHIRSRFLKEAEGLNLLSFLAAIVENMDSLGQNETVKIVADLIDFFHFVDINGDGRLSWEEFVSFVVDQVVLQKDNSDHEKLVLQASSQIQEINSRRSVYCSTVIKELGKLFLGVGEEIQVYALDDKSTSWTKLIVKFPLQTRISKSILKDFNADDPIDILDICYSKAEDIICVLRSDVCLEFFHLSSRSKISQETVSPAGLFPVEESFDKIVARNLPRQPGIILAAGKSKNISAWTISLTLMGTVTAEPHKTGLRKHKDFIRDMIIIDHDPFCLLASCGMDRKVYLWDLDSLTFKSSRSGHPAGVQCLAFDGISTLLAGGFDFTVLGYDLNAEIDRPRFKLSGHSCSITKVVGIGSSHFLMSLDESGELRYWHVSNGDKDGHDHLIDVISCHDDKLNSFDIVTHVPTSINTMHNLMIVGAGRHVHTFKVIDTTPNVGPPIAVHYSKLLQIIIVVHVRCLTFWSAITGHLIQTVRNVVSESSEVITSAVEALGKKIVVAEQKGTIAVFNPLDGSCLRRLRQLPSTIKFVYYSPDKCIIAVGGLGDIFVVSENSAEGDTDAFLRHAVLPETEIVACAYSHPLSLFATVDSAGLLIIWDYQFLSIEFILENCVGQGATACHLHFVELYPLLVVADNFGNFVFIIVGNAASYRRELVWRVKASMEKSIDRDDLKSCSMDDESHTNSTVESNSSPTPSIKSDLFGPRENRAKPLDGRRMLRYRAIPRTVKCLTSYVEEVEEDDFDDDASMESDTSTTVTPADANTASIAPSTFTKNMAISIICGHDDGSIAIYDMTDAFRRINLGPLQTAEIPALKSGYDGRRKLKKNISESELARLLSKKKATAMMKKKSIDCSLWYVWAPHSAAVQSISVVGEYDNILTSSDDGTIQLWSREARFLGVLTRGLALDRVFGKHWSSPVDTHARGFLRQANAERIYKLVKKAHVSSELHTLKSPDHQHRHHSGKFFGSSEKSFIAARTLAETSLDRDRAIGQLRGKQTYTLSAQEIAQQNVAKKSDRAIQAIHDIGKSKRRRRRKRRKVNVVSSFDTLTDVDYYESINYHPIVLKPLEHHTFRLNRFEKEIAAMIADAPDNWSVQSINTQRKLYRNLYTEKAKTGLDTNHQLIIKAKLDALSPDGNFDEFVDTLRRGEGMLQYTRMMAQRTYHMSADGDLLGMSPDSGAYDTTGMHTITELNESGTDEESIQPNAVIDALDNVVKNERNDDVDVLHINESQPDQRQSSQTEMVPPPLLKQSSLSKVTGEGRGGVLSEDGVSHYKQSDEGETSDENFIVDISTSGKVVVDDDAKEPMTAVAHDEAIAVQPIAASRTQLKIQTNTEVRALSFSRAVSWKLADAPPAAEQVIAMKSLGSRLHPVGLVRTLSKKSSHESYDKSTSTTKASSPPSQPRKMSVLEIRKMSKSAAILLKKEIESTSKELIAKRRASQPKGLEYKLQSSTALEKPWERKVRYASEIQQEMSKKSHGKSLQSSKKNLVTQQSFSSNFLVMDTGRQPDMSSTLTDEELLQKNVFGSYRAADIVKAMTTFSSLPSFVLSPFDNKLKKDNNETTKAFAALQTDDDMKRVSLQDFILSDFIQAHPYFEQELRKLLSRRRTNKIDNVSLTLREIISCMCPHLSDSQLSECMRYLALTKRVQLLASTPQEEDVIPEETMTLLRNMFNFFDKEKSGKLHPDIIAQLMETESRKFYAQQQAAFLEGGVIEEEVRIEESAVRKMMSTIKLKVEDEITFDEFVQIFKDEV